MYALVNHYTKDGQWVRRTWPELYITREEAEERIRELTDYGSHEESACNRLLVEEVAE